MPHDWDWAPDGRSTGRNKRETSPAARLRRRLRSFGPAANAILGAIAVFIIVGAGWFIWAAMSSGSH
jgi:hypothetical protein